MSNKLGFIGCGEMASAIIKGLLNTGFMQVSDIHASTKTDKSASTKSKILKIRVVPDNKSIAKDAEIIVLATKPNQIEDVLNEIKDEINGKLIISIAAGVSTKKIEAIVEKSPVIRVMPNTPMLVSQGMCGICLGKLATEKEEKFVTQMLSQVGKVITVEEAQIDIVTAISGSGPAFFYQIFENLAQAGAKLGLAYEKSLMLAIQTAIGSAKMAQNCSEPLPELIASVATKGGCTEVGINTMNELNSQNLFDQIVENTANKAHSLG